MSSSMTMIFSRLILNNFFVSFDENGINLILVLYHGLVKENWKTESDKRLQQFRPISYN